MLDRDNPAPGETPASPENLGETAARLDLNSGLVGITYGQIKDRLQQAVDLLLDGQRMLRSLSNSGTAETIPQLSATQFASFNADAPPAVATPIASPESGASAEVSPSLLRIYTLGRLQICRGDREITTWRSNRARGIFKLLLAHWGRPVPREVITDALWPDSSVDSASVSLRVATHELRQTLNALGDDSFGARCILVKDGKYHLNTDLPVWLDVEQFENHWRKGQSLEKTGRPLLAIAQYQQAELLYQGDFLEMDPYDDAALIRREGLIDIYLFILGKVAEYYYYAADYESCTEFSCRILVKDKCREDAYQRLIACCLKLGQRSRGLRWYQICQETLQRELDCQVSPQTQALYHALTARHPSSNA
ncbi:MAG: hypothetical protein FJ316_01855 [SAR202 cluster bacterium]|nr:hypothetical protein [SAR202 cluster bacterium]